MTVEQQQASVVAAWAALGWHGAVVVRTTRCGCDNVFAVQVGNVVVRLWFRRRSGTLDEYERQGPQMLPFAWHGSATMTSGAPDALALDARSNVAKFGASAPDTLRDVLADAVSALEGAMLGAEQGLAALKRRGET